MCKPCQQHYKLPPAASSDFQLLWPTRIFEFMVQSIAKPSKGHLMEGDISPTSGDDLPSLAIKIATFAYKTDQHVEAASRNSTRSTGRAQRSLLRPCCWLFMLTSVSQCLYHRLSWYRHRCHPHTNKPQGAGCQFYLPSHLANDRQLTRASRFFGPRMPVYKDRRN